MSNDNPQTAKEYFERGNKRFNDGDYDNAIADFDEAIRLNPDFAAAWSSRGVAWGMKEEFDKTINDLNEAIRLNPGNASAWSNRGSAWSGKGEQDKAIDDINEAIRLNSEDAIAWMNRGIAWVEKNEQNKAIDDLNEAVRLGPNLAEVWSNRSVVWSRKGEYEKAIDDLKEAIRLNPKSADAWNNRGNARYAKGEYEKALADCEEALRLNPNHRNAIHNRALILAAQFYKTERNEIPTEQSTKNTNESLKETVDGMPLPKKSQNIAIFLLWGFLLGWIGVFIFVFWLDVCGQDNLCDAEIDPYLFLPLLPAFTMTSLLVSPLVWLHLRERDRAIIERHMHDPKIRTPYLISLMKSDLKMALKSPGGQQE